MRLQRLDYGAQTGWLSYSTVMLRDATGNTLVRLCTDTSQVPKTRLYLAGYVVRIYF